MPPIIYDEHKWESTQNTHVNNYKAGQDLPFRAFVKHSLTDKNTIVEAANVPEAIGYVISPLGIKAGERGDVLYGEHRPHGSDESGLGGPGDGGVEQYANLAAFPVTGVDNILYVAQDTNKTYVWDTGSNMYLETPQTVGNFGDLNDTTFTSLNDQDIAIYDAGSGQWINVPLSSVISTCTPALIQTSKGVLASDFSTSVENQWVSVGASVIVNTTDNERVLIDAQILADDVDFNGKDISFGISIDGELPVRSHILKTLLAKNGDSMLFFSEPLTAGTHTIEIKLFRETTFAGTTTVYAQDLAAVPTIAGTRVHVHQFGVCYEQTPILITENRLGSTLSSTGADWATGFITKFYTEGPEDVLLFLNPAYSLGGAGGTPGLEFKISIDGSAPFTITTPTAGLADNRKNTESTVFPWSVPSAGEHTVEIILDSSDAARPKTLYGFEGLASSSGVQYTGSMVQVMQYAKQDGAGVFSFERTNLAADFTLTTNAGWESTGLTHAFTSLAGEDVFAHFTLSTDSQSRDEQFTMGYTIDAGPIIPIRRDNLEGPAQTTSRSITHRATVILEDLDVGPHTLEFYVFVGQANNLIARGSVAPQDIYWATNIITAHYPLYNEAFDVNQLNFGEVFTGKVDVFGNKIFAKMYTGTLTDSTAAVQTDVIDPFPSGRAIVDVMGAIGSGDTPANAVDVYPVPYNNAGVETVLADYVVAQVRRNATGFIIEHQQIPANSQYRIIIEYTRA